MHDNKAMMGDLLLTVDDLHRLISSAVIRHPDGELTIEGISTHKNKAILWYHTDEGNSHISTIEREAA